MVTSGRGNLTLTLRSLHRKQALRDLPIFLDLRPLPASSCDCGTSSLVVVGPDGVG